MRTTAGLAWQLLRGGGRRDLGTRLLAVLAFAVPTCLLLLTLGVDLGFAHRAARQAWTTPAPATPASPATAVASTRTDFYAGRPVTVVTLGALTAAAPTPPGLPRFPAPGQTWLSPALARLVSSDPGALQERWAGRTVGRVAAAGLATPDQLMVVVGVDAASPVLRGPVVRDLQRPRSVAGPAAISGFGIRVGQQTDSTYRDLSLIASVLLVVPLLVLGGGAARLGLARRDRRLAALRMVGATARQVRGMVAVESGVTALTGALAGALLYVGLLLPASRVSFGGGTWFVPDLWVGPGVLLAVLVGVTLGGVASAVSTLRRVVVSPLGVLQRHLPRDRHRWRALAFVAALVAYLRISRSAGVSVTALVLAFGTVFLTLSLLGPWVLALLGRVMVGTARGPAQLMAGRRLLEDPRAAWRTVAGLALTGFVAGFLALFPSSSGQVTWGSADAVDVAVPAGQVAQARSAAEEGLRAAGLARPVGSTADGGALLFTTLGAGPDETSYLSVPVTPQERETTRTALHRALPGLPVATGTDIATQDDLFGSDLRRASTAVLLASFLVAIASAGSTACAGVLDRRQTYRELHLAGTPLRLLNQARGRETTAPVLLLVLGSLVTGVVCGAPVTRLGLGGGQIDAAGVALLAGTVVAGLVGVRVASVASRPLLRSVTTGTAAPPD